MYCIYGYSVRNASHIYACTHPNPKFMIWPKRPPLAFSVAEMSVAEMSGPKRPRQKCLWPKCPTFLFQIGFLRLRARRRSDFVHEGGNFSSISKYILH